MNLRSTGIPGFDELTRGGLPDRGTTTIVGGPGCGKTVLALQVAQTRHQSEGRAVFVSFEESADQLRGYLSGFGWDDEDTDLDIIDARLPVGAMVTGDFDLGGLFAAVRNPAGGKPTLVVLDGVDVLLTFLDDRSAIRRELLGIREWFETEGIAGILTAKELPANDTLDFLPYLSDCVIDLDHEIVGRTAERTIRIRKFRGHDHSSDSHPFAIGANGVEVPAVLPEPMEAAVDDERVSTGVGDIDDMLDGGVYRATATLISGGPGTAKSTIASSFAAAACARGENVLYAALDEPGSQMVRNMRSVGLDLAEHRRSGRLAYFSPAARSLSPDLHAMRIQRRAIEHDANLIVIDPLSAFQYAGSSLSGSAAAEQLVDFARRRGITAVVTSLLGVDAATATPVGLSTVADTWIHLTYDDTAGERNRALSIMKSRGTRHSNQVRELKLSGDGLSLTDAYVEGGEVLMGTLRWEHEREAAEARAAERTRYERKLAELESELDELEHEERMLQRRREMRARERQIVRSALASQESEWDELRSGRRQRRSSRAEEE